MRVGLMGAVAMAAVALGASEMAQAGGKKAIAAEAPSNAALLERIKELEAAVQALKANQTKSPDQARAELVSAPMIAASAPQDEPQAAPAEPAANPTSSAKPTAVATFDPSDIERALERALVASGATLLNPMQLELEPFIGYASDERDFPVVLDQGPPVRIGEISESVSTVFGGIAARIGLPWGFQAEATVPFVVRDLTQEVSEGGLLIGEGGNDDSGIGDVSLSLAKTMIEGGSGLPALIGRVTWDTDTGDDGAAGALGSGFNELGGELVFVKRQDPLVFVVRGGYTHAFEKSNVQPGGEFGAGLETLLALSPDTSLSFGVSYEYQAETEIGNVEILGSDESRASLLIGGNTVLGQGLVLNVGVTAGLTEDAPDFAVSTGLSFRVN